MLHANVCEVGIIQQKSRLLISGAIIFIIVLSVGCLGLDQQKPKNVIASVKCQETSIIGDGMTVDEMQNNSTICVQLNSTFNIRLKENSRTGNQWHMTASHGLQVSDIGVIWYDEKDIPTTVMPGIKGVHEWRITTKESGFQTVKAILRRPEIITGYEPVFNLTIVVE